MTEALIIDTCRTPRGIGKVGKGALADMHPQHLAATVLKALAARNNLKTAEVDDILWGTSSQRGKQGGDMGRMAALDAGYDVKASGVTFIASLLERVIEEQARGDASKAEAIRASLATVLGDNLAGIVPGSQAAARVKQLLIAQGAW